MDVMVGKSKNFNNDNSGKFDAESCGEGSTNLPELSLLNFLLITANSLLPPWISLLLFPKGAKHLFYSLAVFGLDC